MIVTNVDRHHCCHLRRRRQLVIMQRRVGLCLRELRRRDVDDGRHHEGLPAGDLRWRAIQSNERLSDRPTSWLTGLLVGCIKWRPLRLRLMVAALRPFQIATSSNGTNNTGIEKFCRDLITRWPGFRNLRTSNSPACGLWTRPSLRDDRKLTVWMQTNGCASVCLFDWGTARQRVFETLPSARPARNLSRSVDLTC